MEYCTTAYPMISSLVAGESVQSPSCAVQWTFPVCGVPSSAAVGYAMSGTPDLTDAIIEAKSQQATLARPTNACAAAAATALSNAIAATNAASAPADFDKLLVSLSTLREQAHSKAAEAAQTYADELDPA